MANNSIPKMINDIQKDQLDLEQAWKKLAKDEEEALKEWKKMNMKQKLAGLIDAFKDKAAAKEIWGEKESSSSPTMSCNYSFMIFGYFEDCVKVACLSRFRISRTNSCPSWSNCE